MTWPPTRFEGRPFFAGSLGGRSRVLTGVERRGAPSLNLRSAKSYESSYPLPEDRIVARRKNGRKEAEEKEEEVEQEEEKWKKRRKKKGRTFHSRRPPHDPRNCRCNRRAIYPRSRAAHSLTPPYYDSLPCARALSCREIRWSLDYEWNIQRSNAISAREPRADRSSSSCILFESFSGLLKGDVG